MKVKYIDKRHWRRLIDREYTEVKVNNNRFKGIIGLVTMKKVRDPLEVTVSRQYMSQMTIINGCKYYLKKKRYSITVMFDDEGQSIRILF